jgi:hypothetical protein
MSKARELAELGAVYDSGALSNRNIIINGGMTISQRSTGTVTVSDGSNEGYATVDRFGLQFNASAGGACEMSRSTDTPDGFANSVKIKCSTADSAHTGTESIYLDQRIEAQNLQPLGYGTSGAKQMTISWYMKTVNYTDPISIALETRDGTSEYYVKSYTPTTSWARYTCTVPASTSATFANDSGRGLDVKFVIAGSSSGTHAASSDSTAWSTTRADYRNDIGNFVASTSNEIYITGVQLELGTEATPFEHRSFGDELTKCKRYFEKVAYDGGATFIGGGMWYNSTAPYVGCKYKVTKRAVPTVTSATDSGGYSWYVGGASRTSSALDFSRQTTYSVRVSQSGGLSGSGGTSPAATHATWLELTGSGTSIEIDAEL